MKNSPLSRLACSVFLCLLASPLLAQTATPYAYPKDSTALLLVDPFNDFLSEGGKLWGAVKTTAVANDTLAHLVALHEAAREHGIQVIYVPHHLTEAHDYENWQFKNAVHRGIERGRIFERGSWGGEFHPQLTPQEGDLVAGEHWTSSGFANTDLDMLLKQHGIDHVVIAGIRANTCVEATGRYAVELGYHTTLISDAIAAFSEAEMNATIAINFPTFGHGVLTTEAFIGSLGAAPGPDSP